MLRILKAYPEHEADVPSPYPPVFSFSISVVHFVFTPYNVLVLLIVTMLIFWIGK